MERLENGVVAANECTHGMVKNTQRKQARYGRGRVCSRYGVGGSMWGGLGTFLLAGEAGQVAEATHPRRANPRHVPDVYLQG